MHVLCYIYLPQFCFVLFKNLPEELAEMHIPEIHSQNWVNKSRLRPKMCLFNRTLSF